MNTGELRTFRVPAGWADRIDFRASEHITGWKVEGTEAFLHTDGSPVAKVHLSPAGTQAPPAPHLESSSGEVTGWRASPRSVELVLHDFRPVHLVLAGWPGLTPARVMVDGRETTQTTTAEGRLSLTVPAEAKVGVFID